ncbi:hypothetical protein FV139_01410 [Parahaliea maris]|uniref:Uncharacterized protein n=1 Tax=Parahaliea maris TaxID=2716870 RepID=A0A5C9A828_9GAMM|nr:hypothetical protein [Parahaliea maris]TXS96192.1 hypothetical protein FV139_01410 [Parahaliea maris]
MEDKDIEFTKITGGSGGFDSKPLPSPNGGVGLKLSASALVADWLQEKVDEINSAESPQRQQHLINGFPDAFRGALLLETETGEPLSPGQVSAQGRILLVSGYPASHVFDIEGGVVFIGHGWASEGSTGGHFAHVLYGTFEWHDIQGGGWIALDSDDALIDMYDGKELPDGPRLRAMQILEESFNVDTSNVPLAAPLRAQISPQFLSKLRGLK